MSPYKITLTNPKEENLQKRIILKACNSRDEAWGVARREARAFDLKIKSIEIENEI